MHEKLIADCLEYSTSISNMERAPQGCELIAQAASAIRELMSENKRLKGKIVTPSGGTTFIECEDCKTFTRASRHLDSDCETIAELRAKLAKAEDVLNEAPIQNNCGCNMSGIRETEEWIRSLRNALDGK